MKNRVRVDADLVEQLVQRYEGATALGHGSALRALYEVDELDQRGLDRVGIAQERRGGRLQLAHVAVVI